MKVIKFNDNKSAYFADIKTSEEILYKGILEKLNKNIPSGHIQNLEGPSEDVSIWEISGCRVRVVHDFDYGVELNADTDLGLNEVLALIQN